MPVTPPNLFLRPSIFFILLPTPHNNPVTFSVLIFLPYLLPHSLRPRRFFLTQTATSLVEILIGYLDTNIGPSHDRLPNLFFVTYKQHISLPLREVLPSLSSKASHLNSSILLQNPREILLRLVDRAFRSFHCERTA